MTQPSWGADRKEQYRSLVRNSIVKCICSSKTKKLVMDFRRSRPSPQAVQIEGEEVKVVNTQKYLGLWLDNKMNVTSNTAPVQEGPK